MALPMVVKYVLKYMPKDEEDPEPGDLIEFLRGFYQHWAVYVGDGYVVHLAGDPDSEARDASANLLMSVAVPTKKAMVKREKLEDVAENDKWIINNSLDKNHTPRSPDVIVREANALVGQERPYHLVKQNCEHFATKLRYGKAVSKQVQQFIGAAVGLGPSVA